MRRSSVPAAPRRATALWLATVAAPLAVALAGTPLAAQTGRRDSADDPKLRAADSLIAAASDRARSGDTTRALQLLERATRVAPRYAPAFYERGVLLSRSARLGLSDMMTRRSAGNQIERALELDPNNPRYLIELGRLRLKTPFLRLDAERLFSRALRAAEKAGKPHELAEVHWELGQIFERRYMTTANRRMFNGAMTSVSDASALGDPAYVRELFTIYTTEVPNSGELDFHKAEEHYRLAIAAEPGHANAVLGLLGLLVDAERLEEMVRVARAARVAGAWSPRIPMALGLALHRLGRDEEAEAVFDSALARLDSAEYHEMTSLELITRKEDRPAVASLGTTGGEVATTFWQAADPLRLTRVNEARLEFLSRVTHADLRFSAPEFGQLGWKTDRGNIMIRYGPPPRVASFPPEGSVASGGDQLGRVTTVWWYPETDLRFVFVGPPAMNYARFSGDFRSYAENAAYTAPMILGSGAMPLRIDTVAVQVARFRGEGDAVDVSVFADVPTRRMLRQVDVSQALLETSLWLGDGRLRTVSESRDSSVVRADARDGATARAWRRSLRPGEYHYRVEALQPASARAARGAARFTAEPFPAGALSTSDILVGRRMVLRDGVEAPRSRDDYLIVPNATLTFAPRDTAHLYWENYGVARDSTGSGRIRVELALHLRALERANVAVIRVIGGVADAVGLTPEGDDRVLLRFDRTVALDSRDRVANYLALDLGDAPFGAYTLELTVTDLTTGRKTTTQRAIAVPRPERTP